MPVTNKRTKNQGIKEILQELDKLENFDVKRKVMYWSMRLPVLENDSFGSEYKEIKTSVAISKMEVFDIDKITTTGQLIKFARKLSSLPKRLKNNQVQGDIEVFNRRLIFSKYDDLVGLGSKIHHFDFPSEVVMSLLHRLPKMVLFSVDQGSSFVKWAIRNIRHDYLECLMDLAFDGVFTEEEAAWLVAYKGEETLLNATQYSNAIHEWMWFFVREAVELEEDGVIEVLIYTGKASRMLRESFKVVIYAFMYNKFHYLRYWFDEGKALGAYEYDSLAKFFSKRGSRLNRFLVEENKDLIVRVIREPLINSRELIRFKYTGYHLSQIMRFSPAACEVIVKQKFYMIEELFFGMYYTNIALVMHAIGLSVSTIKTLVPSTEVMPAARSPSPPPFFNENYGIHALVGLYSETNSYQMS